MVRSPTSLLRLLVGVVVMALGIFVTWRFSNTLAALDRDWEQLTHVLPAWIRALPAVVVGLTLVVVPVVVNVQLLRYRRIRLFGVVNLAAVTAFVASQVVVGLATRQPPSSFPRAYLHSEGSLNDPLFAAFVAAFVVGIPYLPRSARRLATATVVLSLLASLGFSDVPAVAWLTDLGIGMTCGAALALLFGTPDSAPDRGTLIDGLARSGIDMADIAPAVVDARGSTPWLGTTTGGRKVFVKVLGEDNRSADLMFRAFRAVSMRNSGDERPMSSLRRSVEHEALMSLRATAAGVDTPELLTVSDVGNDAMLLAFAAIDGDSLDRVAPETITDGLLDEIWRQVVILQDHGIAHRDLRLANVFLGDGGDVALIDFGFAELAASRMLLATDLAELLASTTTVVGVRRAVDAAERAVGAEGLAAAHTRLQLAALGGATRTALKQSGRLEELRRSVAARAAIPAPEYAGAVPLRAWPAVAWSAFAAAATTAVGLAALRGAPPASLAEVGQLGWTLLAALVGVAATWVVAVGSSRDPLDGAAVLMSRLAGRFAELLGPLHTASTALRVGFLIGSGVETEAALGAAGVDVSVLTAAHLAVLYLTVRLSGRDGSIEVAVHPDPVLSAAVVTAVLLLAAVSLLGPLRTRVARDVLVPLRQAPAGFRALVRHTMRLAQLAGGSLFVAFALIGGLVAADRAFGGNLDPPSIALTALVVTIVAAVLPIPGGAGVTEAGLIAGLVLFGEHATVAVPTVVAFRIITFWLPAAVGCWAMQRLRSSGRLDSRAAAGQPAAGAASGS